MDMKQKRISSFFSCKPKSQSVALQPAASVGKAKEDEQAAVTMRSNGNMKQQSKTAGLMYAPKAASKTPDSEEIMYDQNIVGKRIEVYWPLDDAWYKGTVKEFRANTNEHKVLYDDNEVEFIDCRKEQFRLLTGAIQNGTTNVAAAQAGKMPSPAHEDTATAPASKARGSPPAQKVAKLSSSPSSSHKALPSTAKKTANTSAQQGKGAAMGKGQKMPNKRLRQAKGAASDDEDVDLALLDDVEDDVEDDMDEEFDAEAEVDSSNDDDDDDDDDMDLEDEMPRTKRSCVAGKGASKGATGKRPLADKSLEGPGSSAKKNKRESPAPPGSDLKSHTPIPAVPMASLPSSAIRQKQAANIAATKSGKVDLVDKLDPKPKHGTASGSAGPVFGLKTNISTDGERFLADMARRFSILRPDRIMDAAGRRPDDSEYNPRTLHIPKDWFKEAKITEAQQQWWTYKSQNFDSVLLFKVGKFYEMFEMDAYIGVDVLGLQFMKGEKPHAGFPEMAYTQMAETLARAGYRVVVIEQTETPEKMHERNKSRSKSEGTRKVVQRSKVAVLSKGTLMDAEMVASHPEASYAVAVWEEPAEDSSGSNSVNIGMCAVDVAAGQLLLGGWTDDEMRGGLRTQLASLQPVEVVLPKNGLSTASGCVLRATLHSPQMNVLKGSQGSWTFQEALEIIKRGEYFPSGANGFAAIPDALQQLIEASNEAALSALCGMLHFLRDAVLDKVVVPLGRVTLLPDPRQTEGSSSPNSGIPFPSHMHLNAAALENLEVLQNAEGGTQGTLMQILDYCKTPFGRRKLRHWLVRPLALVQDIRARQAAVSELIHSQGEVDACRKQLSGVSDVERAVARLHANAVSGPVGRDAPEVVLYEDVAKKKVDALRSAIMDFKSISKAIMALQEVQAQSAVLSELLSESFWENMRTALSDMDAAADWDGVKDSGRVIPKKGVSPEYDAAVEKTEGVERVLMAYLDQVRAQLKCSVQLVTVNKDELMEIPESAGVPGEFTLGSHKKGYRRYSTTKLLELCQLKQTALAEKEDALANGLTSLVKHFASYNDLWVSAVERVSELDALLSLAGAAQHGDGEMCCPEVVDPQDAPTGPFFSAQELRHVASITARGGNFVPNDVDLGGESALMLLLTGPNMGGKSTLLRQVCCAVLLAQVGAWVPARSMRFTPVDAIFVRMGAKDHIMQGLSTFFVELLETGAMLQNATEHSLVALDELGRGTATSDGAAIAGAVLEHLTKARKCRGMFATHYHYLAKEHAEDPSVFVAHMGCAVHPGKNGGLPELTFLYKLTPGACPKSYGTNVAQLAGLPEPVLLRAAEMSRAYEEQSSMERQEQQGKAGATAGGKSLPQHLLDVMKQAHTVLKGQ